MSLISQLTGAVISLTELLFDLTMTSIKNRLLHNHLNQTIIALNPISMIQSLCLLPYTGLLGTWLTLTAHHLLLNFPVFQSFHLLKMQTSSVTVMDKHAPPSLRIVITQNSSPWFESMRDELSMAMRERRQAERKWRNTKLTIFKDLYRQTKHKVSKLVHIAKCKIYTERIALASSSKELHQIVNTLPNRHPHKILPTIYPSADLPSIFIKHFTNKVEKHRANIASEHVTSTLVTGTTAATFSSFEKVSQLAVKECILNSAPKSCELDPIPSKFLIECLDSILPSFTDLFNSSLASGIFPQCFKSALATPILKKRCLDHNDLNNYRPVSNLCFISEILEKHVLFQVSSYLNSHNPYNTCQSAYRPGHRTETALLKVVNDLFLSLNKGNISMLALLDFSSAFDTIDHTILVHRLHTDFGLTDTVLQWFSSYLTDRTHYVSLCNHCSDFTYVHSGVPQGSVLGPILFTMYTKPLSANIDSHSIMHHSFADDLQLQMSAPSEQQDNKNKKQQDRTHACHL